MAADKVKIDTVEIWEWAMGNWQESYSLSQKDEVLMGIGHWALGIGHWALGIPHFFENRYSEYRDES